MADRVRLRCCRGICYGGDYNPEQWPEEVWAEDVALMREAGVNLVSVGIFSWALLEPRAGEFDFGWLDRLIDLLHANGIAVDLGTPTAAPPAWFYRAHPEAWVVDRDGRRLGPGARGIDVPAAHRRTGAARPRSPRRSPSATATTRRVAVWHVHNEYGAPVLECHCPAVAARVPRLAAERYGDARGAERGLGHGVLGPALRRLGGGLDAGRGRDRGQPGPAARLSPASATTSLRRCFVASATSSGARSSAPTSRSRRTSWPPAPVDSTCGPGRDEVDVVSNDHYLAGRARATPTSLLAMDADLTRSLAGGRPWLLMEHSTSAVNWQPRNIAKQPGEMARNSLSHLGRGADAVLFFQWRASRRGAEKFHSAMLPHGGTATRDRGARPSSSATSLGAAGAGARAPTVRADVALLWDWESFWAQDLEWRPSVDLDHRERIEAFYDRLWRDKLTVDFAHPEADLSAYRLVVAPQLYLLGAQAAKHLDGYVDRAAGTCWCPTSPASSTRTTASTRRGCRARCGEVLGVDGRGVRPAARGRARARGPGRRCRPAFTADVWSEHLHARPGTEVLASFDDGPAAGGPALTRRRLGSGTAWYLATRPDAAGLRDVLDAVYAAAGLVPDRVSPPDLDVVERLGAGGERYQFLVNNSGADAVVVTDGVELLSGDRVVGGRHARPGRRRARRPEDLAQPSTPPRRRRRG